MNLEESNQIFKENKKKNTKKKSIIVGIIFCIIIMMFLLGLIFVLQQIEENRFKLIVDNKEVSMNEETIKNVFLGKDENGNNYINLKILAQLTGYKYTKGDYIEVNEDINSCYIENDYEIVSFKVNNNSFTKYIKNNSVINDENSTENNKEDPEKNNQTQEQVKYTVKSKHNEKEVFKIDLPVINLNDQIYIPMDIVNLACNSKVSSTEKGIDIKSLNHLVTINQSYAATKGYKTLSSVYENIRTIPSNMLVVGDGSKYGVINLETGKEILGTKYDDLKYIQNENKFYIYVDEKVGLVDGKGNTIIAPKNYDSIETFDVDKNLYLVKEDGKYGLLNLEGTPILYTDYDQIGITDIEAFNLKNLDNKNLWFDKIVPIKQGSVWGLYNIEKKEIVLPMNYNGFGYKTQSTDVLGEESVLLIPKETGAEGIVINLNGMYGIFDINKKEEIIPCACSRIYSITENGNTQYYMEFGGYQLEMKEYFESHDLVSVKE